MFSTALDIFLPENVMDFVVSFIQQKVGMKDSQRVIQYLPVILLMSCSTLLCYFYYNAFAPILSILGAEFGFTEEERDYYLGRFELYKSCLGSQLNSIFFIVGCPCSLIISYIADSMSRKFVFLVITFACHISALVYQFFTSYTVLFVYRGISGALIISCLPIFVSVLSDVFPSHLRSVASVISSVVVGCGMLVGQTFSGFVSVRFGWRVFFRIVALTGCFVASLLACTPSRWRSLSSHSVSRQRRSGRRSEGSDADAPPRGAVQPLSQGDRFAPRCEVLSGRPFFEAVSVQSFAEAVFVLQFAEPGSIHSFYETIPIHSLAEAIVVLCFHEIIPIHPLLNALPIHSFSKLGFVHSFFELGFVHSFSKLGFDQQSNQRSSLHPPIPTLPILPVHPVLGPLGPLGALGGVGERGPALSRLAGLFPARRERHRTLHGARGRDPPPPLPHPPQHPRRPLQLAPSVSTFPLME